MPVVPGDTDTVHAVRHTQMILGTNAEGRLIAVPGATVTIRKDGAPTTVYADRTKAALANPVPVGVAAGAPGVDLQGNLTVWMDPDYGYDATVTVGAVTTIVPFPTISPDIEDTFAEPSAYADNPTPGTPKTAMTTTDNQTATGVNTFKGTQPVVMTTDTGTRVVQWLARHAVGTGDQHRIELFPPMDNGRIALTWWATQAKTDAERMLSIEAHGLAEGQSQNPNADNHVSIYSVKNDNTVTKMIEWTWGSQWDGVLKLLHHARVFGTLEVSGASGLRLYNNVALNSLDSGAASRRLLVLTSGNNMTVGDVDNGMNMTLTLKAGGTGQVQIQTANTTRLTLTSAAMTIADGFHVATGTTTGTKIGTATTQKLGFFNATPVVQPSGTPVAAPTQGAIYVQADVQAIATLVNNLRTKLISLGLVA